MSIQRVIEEAMKRGERVRDQFLQDLLDSPLAAQLMKNEKFLNTAMQLFQLKHGIEKKVQGHLGLLMKWLEIPNHDEIRKMEHKLHQLENQIDSIHRQNLMKSLKRKVVKKATTKNKKKTSPSANKPADR